MLNKPLAPRIFKTIISTGLIALFSLTLAAQERDRVVDKDKKKKAKARPTAEVPTNGKAKSGGLTNRIVVVGKDKKNPLVKKTASSKPTNADDIGSLRAYSAVTQSMILQSIRQKLGIRYRYATQGPRTYDCSGFVWKVFLEAGFPITRTSAREYWRRYEPVYGKDRFEFGTLVFFNRLGHIGIVADENGFYHASRSKGVTYSKFKGYWSKRIVGYRRIPFNRFQ